MDTKDKEIINDLLSCLEEYVCIHGFGNLGEAITFMEASKMTGRPVEPFIKEAYKKMVNRLDSTPKERI